MKSSTPASAAMAAAVSGLSPVIITVLMPMVRRSAKFSLIALLHDVLEIHHAQDPAVTCQKRRAARTGDTLDRLRALGAVGTARRLDIAANGVGRAPS